MKDTYYYDPHKLSTGDRGEKGETPYKWSDI